MVVIRKMETADEAFILKINISDEQLVYVASPEEFLQDNKSCYDYFVIEHEGEVVGFFKIDRAYSDVMPFCPKEGLGLRDYVVAPSYQGKGIGTKSIVALVKYLSENYKSFSELYLTVACKNKGAERCYIKGGFVPNEDLYHGWVGGPQYVMKVPLK